MKFLQHLNQSICNDKSSLLIFLVRHVLVGVNLHEDLGFMVKQKVLRNIGHVHQHQLGVALGIGIVVWAHKAHRLLAWRKHLEFTQLSVSSPRDSFGSNWPPKPSIPRNLYYCRFMNSISHSDKHSSGYAASHTI